MDLLKELFARQRTIMELLSVSKDKDNYSLILTLRDIAGEAIEASVKLDQNGRLWKRDKYTIDDVREELIDSLHFLLQAAILLDMDAEVLYNAYIDKNDKNKKRIEQKTVEKDFTECHKLT